MPCAAPTPSHAPVCPSRRDIEQALPITARLESGWTGRLIPLTVDGLIYASSMVMLDSARRGVRVPALARWLLGLGIVATLSANGFL